MGESLELTSRQMESWSASDIVLWALDHYGDGLWLASSFGAEDMVLIDLMCQKTPHPHIFTLDTGLLFPETYDLIKTVEERYRVSITRVVPELTLEEQKARFQDALWQQNPDLCCQLRKVMPLERFLQDKKAWITGIRRDQTPVRAASPIVGWDTRFQLVKINPLARWTYRDVFRYLVAHQVPYNPLHDQGYPSIGCVPCTRAIRPGEALRDGRWAEKEKTECGLHQ